jgi:hypothetical protein
MVIKKTNIVALDKTIAEIARYEKVISDHAKNPRGLQRIRREIKKKQPHA